MDKDWWSRLQAWKERTEASLRNRWYLWPFLWVGELFWHRVDAQTNDFLDKHGLPIVASVTRHIPSDPIVLAVVLAVVILLGLAIHAYSETRPGRPLRLPRVEPPKLEIVSIWDHSRVAFEQVVYGVATPGSHVELMVFAGGLWHSQGRADTSGNKWKSKCYFGHPESPAESSYKLVAVASEAKLPTKLSELPADLQQSEIVSVVRSTPAIVDQPHEPANIQTVHTWVVEAAAQKYPTKIRYQMKNASLKCADVTMQGYKLVNPLVAK